MGLALDNSFLCVVTWALVIRLTNFFSFYSFIKGLKKKIKIIMIIKRKDFI